YEHEDYSIASVKWIFRYYIDKNPSCDTVVIKAEDVAALLGDESVPLTRTTIIWRELISGQMDADRADYLLRDSLHLGVNYGLYDKNRLVNCITVGPPTESSDCFLAIEDGGRHVAESLVIARYQMFSQVYFHRVRRAFDYHVEQAMKEVLKQSSCGDGLFPPPTDVKRLNDYLAFDDWDMYGAFKAGKGGEHGERILRRKPYKCTGEWDEDLSCEEKERVDRDLRQYKGYLDKGATTKWYKLDKDITIYDPKQDKVYPLSYKSELIKAMPALPTVARLFIDHDGKGAKS
ncbi:MAG: hypothetical protein FWC72_05955, partial [Oscillospiraceae bacterium]|nr:hypothetical protein [Oscillospiraceae bacterium]